MGGQKGDVVFFEDLRREDVPLVGGKNSSLGEINEVKLIVPQ